MAVFRRLTKKIQLFLQGYLGEFHDDYQELFKVTDNVLKQEIDLNSNYIRSFVKLKTGLVTGTQSPTRSYLKHDLITLF